MPADTTAMDEAPRDTADLQPGDLVKIPEGSDSSDVQSIRDSLFRARRNAKIREAYEALKDDNGQFPEGYESARETVAERFHVSVATVRKALTGS